MVRFQPPRAAAPGPGKLRHLASMRACASGLAWRHLGASRRLAPLSRQKTTIFSPHDRPLRKERDVTPQFNPNELDERGKLHLGCNRICDASVEAVPTHLARLQELSTPHSKPNPNPKQLWREASGRRVLSVRCGQRSAKTQSRSRASSRGGRSTSASLVSTTFFLARYALTAAHTTALTTTATLAAALTAAPPPPSPPPPSPPPPTPLPAQLHPPRPLTLTAPPSPSACHHRCSTT